MAQDYESGLMPRSFFKAPRVPFDFRAVFLGVMGYLVFWAGGLLLAMACDDKDAAGSFLMWFAGLFRGVPFIGPAVGGFLGDVFQVDRGAVSTNFWHVLIGGGWFFAVWSVFGQAIHRIVSLRIARDESLPVLDGIKFGLKNWIVMIQAPVIIGAAMGFFVLCNAIAGAVTSIPFLGGILAIVFLPLAVISTLLILLIGLGGVFGLPLIGAAAAWEVNGSLDAISRAFSYVFARPLQYFWNFFLIFLFTGVILLVGNWFNYTLLKSVDAFTWSDVQTVLIDPPEDQAEYGELDADARALYAKLREETKREGYLKAPTGGTQPAPLVRSFKAVIHAPWSHKLNALVLWVLVNLIWLGIFGYALFWVHGAATSVYADLREDVDGTEETEIWVAGEDEDFDALAEGGPAAEAGTTPPAAGEAPVPEGESAPPAGDDEV